MPPRIRGRGRAHVPGRTAAHRHRALIEPEMLERRDLLATAAPQILLTPAVLSGLRQEAVAHTPRWEAFAARLDANLRVVIADDIGSYQGEQLEWIEDYALGYQVLKDTDPATAAGYADKAIGLMKSALHDYQKGSWVARQFLVRGDGATRSFALPNADLDPATLQVYLSPVTTQAVVHGAANGPDAVDYYRAFLKVSDSPDGAAAYLPGTDWRRDTDLANDQLDWSPAGREPARGATYYVTSASIPDADATAAYTLSGRTITFAVAPSRNQAVFVQYIYGTHASNGSTLAWQQTSAGDGGFNSIFIDDTYSSRHLGKPLAMGLDWLDGYVGFTSALQQEVAGMLVRWSDYLRDNGYLATHPESNMEDGAYSLRALTALALGPRNAAGPRLLADVVAYREQFLVPLLQNPTTSLKGGFWVEGWHYGHNAIQEVLLVARALETAGRIDAAAEHRWASEVVDTLASGQSAPGLAYDGGEVYDFPFHLLDRALFPILGTMAGDAAERSYARYMGRDYPDAAFRDPSPPADYRAAYSPDETPGSGGPAAELTRQVVYLRPEVVVVYDRATTTHADYDKQLRWNLASAPTVAGNAFVETVGGSRLFGETFSSVPLTTALTPVVIGSGGQSATVQRLIVENAAPTARVRYVTAFQVTPSTTATRAATRHVTSVDGRMEGVQVGGHVVLFGRDGTIDPATPVAYAVTAAGAMSHLLTNLVAGRAYAVRVNGSALAPVTASDQGTVTFTTTVTGGLTVEIGPSGTAPALAPPGAVGALATTYGTASAATRVAVAGWNLTGDVTATAPPGFQVSSDGATFATTACRRRRRRWSRD